MKIKKKSNAVRVPPLKKAIKVKRKSLDAEESTVSTALKNVKRVLETKNKSSTETVSLPKTAKLRIARRRKRKIISGEKHQRGIVYLGHIPHGFYEEEMKKYFNQFGRVTKIRVARSKNTGRSRGYGYIEFVHPEVAKIAAESMNNYLMCGRLVKATYIPPEKQHGRYFAGKPWDTKSYPKKTNRRKVTMQRNTNISQKKQASFIQSTKDKLAALERKLKEKGYDLRLTSLKVEN